MITQYSGDTYYSAPSTEAQNIVANSVSPLDKYILMQTGKNEYTALIKNMVTGKVEKIVISRTDSSYSSNYVVARSESTDFGYTATNEYYVYSNDGIGRSLSSIPSYQGILTYGMAFIVCLLSFAVLFKGVLFKCLKSRR